MTTTENIMELPVQIVRFVDPWNPGVVEAELEDAAGCKHVLRDKVPLFTKALLNETSPYPQAGAVSCVVVEYFRDNQGRELARVRMAPPAGVESIEGLIEFVVLASQLHPWPVS